MPDTVTAEEIDIIMLFEAIYLRWGYDFRCYAKASIKRRLTRFLKEAESQRITDLQYEIIRNKNLFIRFIEEMTINVTEMFRDPGFYMALREKVVQQLSTYPHLKIWHAGCATGEEAYSMNILLKEEFLISRAMIYATDINKAVIDKSRKGIYSDQLLREFAENYRLSGGKSELSDYYTKAYDHFIMDQSLRDNIVFSQHDLATDYVFGEMQLIMCRNVLIYFNRSLQNRVLKLFHDSLDLGGFLCLGTKETLDYYEGRHDFEVIDRNYKIYQLVKPS